MAAAVVDRGSAAELLDAADARGWKTHLFEHPKGWADRLVAEGLLTQGEAK